MPDRPRVLLTRRIPRSILERLEADVDVDLYEGTGTMTADELRVRVRDKDGLVSVLTDKVTRELLGEADRFKVVSNIAVGYENIDVPAARERGVVVTNTPDVLTEATAELTWSLILAVARRIAEGDRLIRRGCWTSSGAAASYARLPPRRPLSACMPCSPSTTCRSTSCSSARTSSRFTRR